MTCPKECGWKTPEWPDITVCPSCGTSLLPLAPADRKEPNPLFVRKCPSVGVRVFA